MNIEEFREQCLALPYVTEDMPFDETTVVYRLKGKIFACISTDKSKCIAADKPDVVVLKCDPEKALELRASYYAIEGAWHWNKKYWNQITLDGSVPDDLILDLIHHAYAEVNKNLPKQDRVGEEGTLLIDRYAVRS